MTTTTTITLTDRREVGRFTIKQRHGAAVRAERLPRYVAFSGDRNVKEFARLASAERWCRLNQHAARTMMERFADTCDEFKLEITKLASDYGQTVEQVYGRWVEYCDHCHDMSALLSEFERWFVVSLDFAWAWAVRDGNKVMAVRCGSVEEATDAKESLKLSGVTCVGQTKQVVTETQLRRHFMERGMMVVSVKAW